MKKIKVVVAVICDSVKEKYIQWMSLSTQSSMRLFNFLSIDVCLWGEIVKDNWVLKGMNRQGG